MSRYATFDRLRVRQAGGRAVQRDECVQHAAPLARLLRAPSKDLVKCTALHAQSLCTVQSLAESVRLHIEQAGSRCLRDGVHYSCTLQCMIGFHHFPPCHHCCMVAAAVQKASNRLKTWLSGAQTTPSSTRAAREDEHARSQVWYEAEAATPQQIGHDAGC